MKHFFLSMSVKQNLSVSVFVHKCLMVLNDVEYATPGGGGNNFICTGVCGHRIGKLTHPQTKSGQKTDPFSDYLQ